MEKKKVKTVARTASASRNADAENLARSERWQRRRSWTFRWGMMLTIPTIAIVCAFVLTQQTPDFYRQRVAHLDPTEEKLLSREFLKQTSNFVSDVKHLPAWAGEFREEEINAWLAVDFAANHASQTLPTGIHDPRVAIEDGRMRVGLVWQFGPVNTVVQVAVRLWVPKPDTMVLELEGAWAGALPLPTTQIRQVVEAAAAANKMEVHWRRKGPHLVAVLELSPTQREVILQQVELSDGKVHIQGVSTILVRTEGPSGTLVR